MLLVDACRVCTLIVDKQNKQTNRMCALCRGLHITLKYTFSKQHPTPNPKKEKKRQKKQTPHPKYLVALNKVFFFFDIK
jgi:hypothetical protein